MINYEDLFINKIYGNLLSHQRVNDDNLLKINISITNDCNQKCEYCIANTPNIKNKYYINKEYIKFLFKYLKKNNFDRKFRINLLGGEPTLHTELNDIIDSIKYNYSNNIIKLFTNGSQSIDYYKNMIHKYNNLTFDISYHPKFANTNKYIDIINMFKNNNPNNIYYIINIVLVYEYYDKILDFINKANDINGNIKFILLFGVDYVNTKYNIFNDIINNMKNNSEFLEYKLTFENKEIILPYKDIAYYSTFTNIFKNMKCNIYDTLWSIYNNEIMSLCNTKKSYKLLPNEIKLFINDYYNYRNGVECQLNTCNMDCLIDVYKHKN